MGRRREAKNTTQRRPEDWFPPVRSPGTATTIDIDTAITAALTAVDINTTAPITGGGNLSTDRTLALNGTKAEFNSSCSDGDFLFVGDITQYTDEMARDALGLALVGGTGITITVSDPGDTITIASTITQYTDEMARDALGAALVAGTNITITVNDAGDTITIDAAGASGYTDEQAQDAIGTILTDTATIDFTYSDATPSITADVKANSIGATQLIAADVNELAQDAVGTILAATGIATVAYADATPSITVGVPAAVASDLNTGTDTTKAVTSDALAGSNFGKAVITIAVTDPNGLALTTGDGKAYYRVPSALNGMNLVAVAAALTTVSSSGIPTIQIANVTDAVDMLSTKLTIDASETDSSTAATAAVIDGAHDDVATADMLRIDCDVAGTGAKGLLVEMQFQLP